MRSGNSKQLRLDPQHLLFAVGYAVTSIWATVLLFSSTFSQTSSPTTIALSMLPGMVACIGVLLLRENIPPFDGRTGAASLYATGMAVGTFLCTYPALASMPAIHMAGLMLSGFFAILLLLSWFSTFAQLSARTIVLLGGLSLVIASVGCFIVLSLPNTASSIVMSLLPLVSLAFLPKPNGTHSANRRPALGDIIREAISWKTLLGVAISFFVIGIIGTLSSQMGFTPQLSPAYLGIPVLIAAFFIVSALIAPERVDASILFKLLLLAVAASAFLFVHYNNTNLSLVFFLYIVADVLLWTVLALAAKKTPVEAFAVFAIGWLAECVGNVTGHVVASAIGDTPLLLGLVVLLILIAVGFAFGDGLFVLDLDDGKQFSSDHPLPEAAIAEIGDQDDAAGATNQTPSQDASIAAFVERHGLSAREADVFALWVTGHGQKYIQDTLFISESTVKTHLRSIYRKCDTHSRAEIIALFEEEQSAPVPEQG